MKITDEKLYELCRKYGAAALEAKRKFIGLLPEVYKRKLFEKKGFSSIFEFAAKLCGLSQKQVRLTLNLERRFEEMPTLKSMLENGEASINKLARIVSIATPDNEEELAANVKNLPMSALNTLVMDEKLTAEIPFNENANGLFEPFFEDESLFEQTINFRISEDVAEELNDLNAKGIDVNDLIRQMLAQHKGKIAADKVRIAAGLVAKKADSSRYIPAEVKRIIREEHGEKCSLDTCRKPADTIHHTQRFSLSKNHDPRFLAPLCHDHHAIAHSIDQKYQSARLASIAP